MVWHKLGCLQQVMRSCRVWAAMPVCDTLFLPSSHFARPISDEKGCVRQPKCTILFRPRMCNHVPASECKPSTVSRMNEQAPTRRRTCLPQRAAVCNCTGTLQRHACSEANMQERDMQMQLSGHADPLPQLLRPLSAARARRSALAARHERGHKTVSSGPEKHARAAGTVRSSWSAASEFGPGLLCTTKT